MKLGSLFDGVGGWLIAATRAGVAPVWSSEVAAFPQAVTACHFPNVKQLGDITKIDGAAIEPVDIVTMGSPCQDLSIAGTRAGLAGERSGLFVRAIEIIRQMRRATNGQYPKYAVWENVTGAYTSNKGMDFKAVLEAFTETEIPVPGHGKWAGAGMVRSRNCCVVWRTLDAQYWGVPQRRRRIFLVADYTGGGGTEEILFKPESLPRDTATSKAAQEKTAADTGNSTETAKCYDMSHACDAIRVSDKSPTLQARMGTGGNQIPLTYSRLSYEEATADDKGACLRSSGGVNGGGSENLVLERDDRDD